MPRVQLPELMSAINQVKALTPEQTGKMLDEIYKEQKNLLSSILALRDKGLYAQQHIDTLMYILLVTWQSLKNANVRLKPISIKLQKEQLAAYLFYFELADKQPEEKRPAIVQHYNDDHLENYLMNFAANTMRDAGFTQLKPEIRKYLVMVGSNLINCVAKAEAYPKLAVER